MKYQLKKNGDDFMKNNNNFNKKANSVDTNEKNNGDDVMELLSKKQFKGLKKGEAYTEYLSVGELADAFRHKADKAETLLKDAKKEAIEAQREAVEAQRQAEVAELRAVKAEGKADAGLDLLTELQNDLDELVENRDEAFERYERLGARMTGKKNRANIDTGIIRHLNNIIRTCKKEIEQGKDVEGNKATIIELSAEIRNIQRQVEAATGTFNEMKVNKTIVSEEIDQMDTELNKRYQLQGLLGELGYIE